MEKVILGLDCYGRYIELQSGKLYIDVVYQDMVPGDRVTLSICKEKREE